MGAHQSKTRKIKRDRKTRNRRKRGESIAIIRYSKESSPIVECVVQGCLLHLVVDIGSRITLISERALQKLVQQNENPPIPQSKFRHHNFIGISGGRVDIKGCYTLDFTLGQSTFSHPCYVISESAAVPVDGILGQDLLAAHDVDVLTTRKALRLGNDEVPIVNWQKSNDVRVPQTTSSLHTVPVSVRLCNESKIPPMSFCWAKSVGPKLLNLRQKGNWA